MFSTTNVARAENKSSFAFTPENFRRPQLSNNLNILDVSVTDATPASLKGYGFLVDHPDDFRVEDKTFEIVKWPVQGWRQLDPLTGDEAGTTEGQFEVEWRGDFFFGRNLAINTPNNVYLDGLGTKNPENATEEGDGIGTTEEGEGGGQNALYLWMSDYHPDGGQLFFPFDRTGTKLALTESEDSCPFFVCLGKNTHGDDVRPEHMRGFKIPEGKGVYVHPGTWHNGIYTHRARGPRTFFTRQGRIHARVSCSWAAEFDTMLRLRLEE